MVRLLAVSLLGLCLTQPAFAQTGRRVITDDATGFNAAAVQQTTGVKWNVARPFDVSAQPNGDQFGAWAGTAFALRGGNTVIGPGLTTSAAYEDGQMFLGGDPGTPTLTPNFISLFQGANLVSGTPFNYRESVGAPNNGIGQGGYRLGEFSVASANGLALLPNGGGYDPNTNDPAQFGFRRRLTWFGLTDDVDPCSAQQLDLANGNIAGTACDKYATLARYFGQIELHDVGTKDDGDFDLFIGLGYGGTMYAPDGTQVSGYGNTSGYPGTATGGGFRIGNQEYFFTSAQVNNGSFLSEFHFRNGVACAVQADGTCSGDFTVSDPGGGGGGVPAPGAALLLIAGLAVGARALRKP
jgi:hypothetical protein